MELLGRNLNRGCCYRCPEEYVFMILEVVSISQLLDRLNPPYTHRTRMANRTKTLLDLIQDKCTT